MQNIWDINITGDEFLKLNKIAESFYNKGIPGNPPRLVIFTGGVGSGKTTSRKQMFPKDYVHFEFGEIFVAVRKEFGENYKNLANLMHIICDLILVNVFQEKKNIVTEIIGDEKNILENLVDFAAKKGYEVHLKYLTLDPVKAYERHLKAVNEDPEYFSAFHSQEATLSFLLENLK